MRKEGLSMNKKVLRAGAVSAVAAGVGAAAVMAGKRRSKKKRQTAIIVIRKLASLQKTAREFTILMVTMKPLQDRKNRKESKKRVLI